MYCMDCMYFNFFFFKRKKERMKRKPACYHTVETKAMRKKIISGFSCFAKDETKFFSYSNLVRNLIDSFVFAKISLNKCGRKCETQKSGNKYENNQIYM